MWVSLCACICVGVCACVRVCVRVPPQPPFDPEPLLPGGWQWRRWRMKRRQTPWYPWRSTPWCTQSLMRYRIDFVGVFLKIILVLLFPCDFCQQITEDSPLPKMLYEFANTVPWKRGGLTVQVCIPDWPCALSHFCVSWRGSTYRQLRRSERPSLR